MIELVLFYDKILNVFLKFWCTFFVVVMIILSDKYIAMMHFIFYALILQVQLVLS